MTTKTVGPCPELETLVREGEQLLNDEIHVTFTEEDRQTAGPYLDATRCILCTALRRMGFNVLSVSESFARIDTYDGIWLFDTDAPANPVRHENTVSYKPSIVGQTLILRRAKS